MRLPLRIMEHPDGESPVASWSCRSVIPFNRGTTEVIISSRVMVVDAPLAAQAASLALRATSVWLRLARA